MSVTVSAASPETAVGPRSSRVTPALAVTLPAGLTDHQAVAVATAHATAWYGLHDQARIASGDRVLIHSATGGVGQAAIAIARAAGAEIFATAGSHAASTAVARHRDRACLRLAEHRVRRADPPRHRRLRRGYRAQLPDRRSTTRRARIAGHRRTVRRDRQTRRLRQHPAGAASRSAATSRSTMSTWR